MTVPSGSAVPSAVFSVAGTGNHGERIASFELALRDAGIAPYNLVPVSSVIPPDADVVPAEDGRAALEPGQVVHAVLARCDADGGPPLRSAVGVARPEEGHGYAVERCRSGEGGVAADAEALARELVEGEPVESFNVSAEASPEEGTWTTTVAAVVFVP